MPRKEVGVIVHYAVIIVAHSKRIDQGRGHLPEVILIARQDVPVKNIDILITIRSTLLVPEPENMANFMNYHMKGEAGVTEGHPLRLSTIMDSSYVRAAPRTWKEANVVVLISALLKPNTRIVFPVFHGFMDCPLISLSKSAGDNIVDHSIRPQFQLFACGPSSSPCFFFTVARRLISYKM